MADINYEFFKKNHSELIKNFLGKYVVIKECKVIASYKTFDEAYNQTIKTEKIGTFLIQYCSKEEENTNCIFYNNIVFS